MGEMKRKIIFIIISSISAFFVILLFGCSNKYGAKMYSNSNDWIQETFLSNNKVSGAYYEQAEADGSYSHYYDDTSPKFRLFVIENETTFNSIFIEDKLKVDFEYEVIYLYIESDENTNSKYKISKIELKNEKMSIYYKLKRKNKNTTAPYQRCLIVKMKKNDAKEVEFIKK